MISTIARFFKSRRLSVATVLTSISSISLIFLESCYVYSVTPEKLTSSNPQEEKREITQGNLVGQRYQVLSIGDGDTIRVQKDGKKISVRLACIDSAELKQYPYGEQAKQRLQAILPINTFIYLKEQTVDRYGRIVAEVYKNDMNVNLSLVVEGQAVAYRKYLQQCDAGKYLNAEEAAKSKGLAFWSQVNPIMPWDFRKDNRKSSTQANRSQEIKNSKCDRAYPNICIPSAPPDLDCSEILHRRFKVVGDDPHQFDGDRNGIGCER